jgi:hypothetical protein
MSDQTRPLHSAHTPPFAPPYQPYPPTPPARKLPSPPPPPPSRTPAPATRRRRSVAWIYYTILAVLGLIFAVSKSQPGGLLISALCAAYATYLFRGGRFVIWIW